MGGSRRGSAWRGGEARRGQAGQNVDGTVRPDYNRLLYPLSIEISERLFERTKKPTYNARRVRECKPRREKNKRVTIDLFAGLNPLFVPVCRPVDRRIFISVHVLYRYGQ